MSSLFHIELEDRLQTLSSEDLAFFHHALTELAKQERVTQIDLSVAFVDNAEIHRVNQEFLQHDYPTDVISFLFDEEVTPQGRALEGELVIGLEYACQIAEQNGWSWRDELVLYGVHGLLHLCGYDDQDPASRQIMRQQEGEWIRRLGLRVSTVDRAVASDHPVASESQPGSPRPCSDAVASPEP